MNRITLKELERKAFRSTYQDGLWDLYFGLIVICMSIFLYRPATGYSPLNIVLMLASMVGAYALFWAGKRFITLPRMGQVKFGEKRARRKKTMFFVLGVVVLIQVSFLIFQFVAWRNPEFGDTVNTFLQEKNAMDLAVATIGSLFVGPSMILIAYFMDFPRGYFIAVMMALAVFLMILLNQPIYSISIGILIAVPGIVLFVRFLQKYPLHEKSSDHE
ncbi:MAG: hypothetical protein JSU79_10820 [Dehalococcoidales bacterium]|nr:MAG: hypothetical protein JSU79_10820 [Dehalococcoidales bacterium]